jgi:DNA-directed RNA polymerase subunit RPC12/RpoP
MKNKHKYQRWNDDASDNFEKIRRKRDTNGSHSPTRTGRSQGSERKDEFKCTNCGSMVSLNREVSGVNNRNHCPYCLWSRHLDQRKAGDRLSTCRGRMEPLGLTVKHTLKRYQSEKQGELMLIHRCVACGKLSINRIAGDDNTLLLNDLFLRTQRMPQALAARLSAQGILPLKPRDITLVQSQLFGWQSILAEFEGELEVMSRADQFVEQDQ